MAWASQGERNSLNSHMRTVCLLLLLSASRLVVEAAEFRGASLYYLPFHYETYKAVTPDNIKQKAKYKVAVTNELTVSRLFELTSWEKSSRLDTNRIRLMLVTDGRKRIVDAEGNVSDGKLEGAIGAERFQQLKKQILATISKGANPVLTK